MAKKISSSVGRGKGKNATNHRADVKTVQNLLAAAATNLRNDDYDPGTPDGLISTPPRASATVAAIVSFQKRFMRNPDGIVEPGRKTMSELNNASSGASGGTSPASTPAAASPATPAPATPVVGGAVSLNSFVGKGMSEICPSSYADTSNNHCAHFVGHALNITVGLTCHGMTTKKKRKGERASLRVHEIFAACATVAEYDSATMAAYKGLMFVSGTSNFRTKNGRTELRNVPKKHIGVLLNGTVWHYSNSRNRVVTQTPTQFIKHYRGQKNALWYGSIPAGGTTNFNA